MKTVRELHSKAIEFNEQAILLLKKEGKSASDKFLTKAFEMEKQAFMLFNKESKNEPTRSILLTSAINLAVEAGLHLEAEKLIGLGLTLDLSPDFKSVLRQKLQDISFKDYLANKEFKLAPNELQISLSGSGVGSGIIDSREAIDRIEKIQRLVYRTAHRILMDKPFKDRLRKPTKKEDFSCSLIAQPVPGSFSFTLRFGTDLSKKNSLFPDNESSSLVIDDILQNIDRINKDRQEELNNSIPDETYRLNFLALASKIAPDGKTIKTMNLVSTREGVFRHIEFNKPKTAFSFLSTTSENTETEIESQQQLITLIGTLSFADADMDTIKLTDVHKIKHKIIVPKGLLTDIVKPYFKDEVEIHAIKKGKEITLQDINPI